MQYSVGMYGGSFDPLHIGHINIIIEAASMCKELHIILSYCKARDIIDYRQRYQWLVMATKDLENVTLHAIEDTQDTKESYNWEKGAEDIKKAVGKHIDIVFCGSDYSGKGRFENLYKDSQIKYISRDILPVSSTQIRENPFEHWKYIPKVVQPFYVKKVLIVGSESTGKSTLTRNLANYYNTVYVEEVGRTISERAKTEDMIIESDFYEIMIRHKAREFEQLEKANKLLFIDTDCLTTMFYGQLLCSGTEYEAKYNTLATVMNRLNTYDLVLFLNTDVEFIQDGTRNEEIKQDRDKYSNKIKQILQDNGVNFVELSGTYCNRFKAAKLLIDTTLGGKDYAK